MKGIIAFFKTVAWVVGIVGGIGYTIMSRAWVIAVCLAVVALLSFPEIRKAWKELM